MCEPVGMVEIAERLGRRENTVSHWWMAGEMPEPQWTVGGRKAWDWPVIEAWARATGRELTDVEVERRRRLPGPGVWREPERYEFVVEACRADGGSWRSISVAAASLSMAHGTARRVLGGAAQLGLLEQFEGRGIGYRLPVAADGHEGGEV